MYPPAVVVEATFLIRVLLVSLTSELAVGLAFCPRSSKAVAWWTYVAMSDLGAEAPQFSYGETSLLTCPASPDGESEFDTLLRQRWDAAMDAGLFRFHLHVLRRVHMPGHMNYLAIHNPERGELKRASATIMNLQQEFDPDKFNFNKIRGSEVLFSLQPHSGPLAGSRHRHLVIINDSPIEYGHILLLPQVSANHSQKLTAEALHLAIDVALLSSNRYWIVAFNSLCALASVNHLHFHAYYSNGELPTANWPVQHIIGPVYTFSGYPAHAFILQWNGSSELLAKDVQQVGEVLLELDVAHNIFMLRGKPLDGKQQGEVLRVIIYLRKHFVGAKVMGLFNVAAVEFSGHLVIYGKVEDFERMTEDAASEKLREASVDDLTMNKVKQRLMETF